MKLINLIATTDALELKLAWNVVATQADWTCSYYDITTATGATLEGVYTGTTNNTTAVVICASPAAGHVRTIKEITVYNADSWTIIPIVQFNANGTIRVVIRNSLTTLASRSVGDMSFYTDISGKVTWPASATDGNLALFDSTSWKLIKDWWAPVTATSTTTLTNKRITPRIISATSYTTDTGTSLNADNCDMFIVTAQTGALKFNNPWGTPTDWQKLIISVASSTTSARALTWDTLYWATTVALPTTTTATVATLTIGFIYSISKSLWQCVWVA